jgi:hypothetical protein
VVVTLSDKVHCIVTDEGKNFLSAVTTLKEMEIVREGLRCACHRIQLTVKRALLDPECSVLMKALKKCQSIVLVFKNGWMSRKRDVLRKHQEKYIADLKEEVEKLNVSIVEHATRERREAIIKQRQLLKAAEEDVIAQSTENGVRSGKKKDCVEEVKEFSVIPVIENKSDSEEDSDTDDSSDDELLEEKEDDSSDIAELFADKQDLKALIAHIFRKKALVAVAATRWLTWVAVAGRCMMWKGPLMKALDEIAEDTSFRKKKKQSSEVPADIPAAIASMRFSDEEVTILDQFQKLGTFIIGFSNP